jgi:alkyl hydroperoxide reductase subunit AhpF
MSSNGGCRLTLRISVTRVFQESQRNFRDMTTWDCIVIGSGHAGSSAALSAAEHGCKVLVVDKCPREWVGGNGYFTAGAHRTVHGGLRDLQSIINNLTPEAADHIDMDPYTAENFKSDIMRLGGLTAFLGTGKGHC